MHKILIFLKVSKLYLWKVYLVLTVKGNGLRLRTSFVLMKALSLRLVFNSYPDIVYEIFVVNDQDIVKLRSSMLLE